MWLSRLLTGMVLIVAVAAAPARAAQESEAFVRSVANRAFAVTGNETMPSREKSRQFDELLRETFDMDGLGPSLLGSYWFQAESWERQAFGHAFKTAIATVYMDKLYLYPGQVLTIDGHRDDGDFSVVHSRITTRGRPDVSIEWHVGGRDGTLRILDTVFDGGSVNAALRREYRSVVRRNAGQLGALIDSMNRQQALLMEAEC